MNMSSFFLSFANKVVCTVTKSDKQFIEAIKESPASVLVAVVCFFSVWSVLGLAGFHTYLTTSNQTTNEDVSCTFLEPHAVSSNFFLEQWYSIAR